MSHYSIFQVSGGRLANLNIHEDARLEPIKKKRQNVSRGEKSRKIAKHLKGADVSTITEVRLAFFIQCSLYMEKMLPQFLLVAIHVDECATILFNYSITIEY